MNQARVYLIPSLLHEEAISSIPPQVLEAVKDCQVFFVENERTARRFLKKIWKEMVIDDYKWFPITRENPGYLQQFQTCLKENMITGIISEAGCPGIADPGQELVALAHQAAAEVIPVSGPSSIILALMASGMNGQQFFFRGYLPIKDAERTKALRDLENDSRRNLSTQVFIETPYRNEQLFQTILRVCQPATRLSLAVNLTAPGGWVRTRSIAEWKKDPPSLHKQPAIFSLQAGR